MFCSIRRWNELDKLAALVSVSLLDGVWQSYELQMTANDEVEFQEVREWEQLFHDLIEGIMLGEGEGGGCWAIMFQ